VPRLAGLVASDDMDCTSKPWTLVPSTSMRDRLVSNEPVVVNVGVSLVPGVVCSQM
jgi:hypothetical protein